MAQLTDEQLELAGEAFAMLRRVLQRNNLEDTLKEWNENYDAPLTTEQQGIFNVAYAEARSHGWKPKQKKSKWR